MKSREQFNKEVFDKYEYYKNKKKDNFFYTHLYRNSFLNISKIVATFIICIIATIGVVYAGVTVYNNKQVKINPTYTEKMGDTNMNNIWVGTFQLVWNEFMDQRVKGKIEFEDGNNYLSDELNKKSFSKDMLNTNDYYIKIGKTQPELKEEISNDVKNKFNIQKLTLLDNINFNSDEKFESYTLYSMLFKKFTFIKPFDKLKYLESFASSNEKIQYFGINNASDENLNDNVEVLFYNNESDFAVKLRTNENEEVLLYRSDSNDSFMELYTQIVEKNKNYNGDKEFKKHDELKIPYINIDTIINYSELCGKIIKNTNGLYIKSALQNVKFSLNEKGGNLISEAGLKDIYLSLSEDPRFFYFTDKFILFLKEADKIQPYFALKVDNTDLLVVNP